MTTFAATVGLSIATHRYHDLDNAYGKRHDGEEEDDARQHLGALRRSGGEISEPHLDDVVEPGAQLLNTPLHDRMQTRHAQRLSHRDQHLAEERMADRALE